MLMLRIVRGRLLYPVAPLFIFLLFFAAFGFITRFSRKASLQSRIPQISIIWLHGLGDSGPANEYMKTLFTSPPFVTAKWSFPSAPKNPVTCNNRTVTRSWFDIIEIPITAGSPKNESSLMHAVRDVHALIDTELANGIRSENIFLCGFSQGGALTLTSALLYPHSLGGAAVFSGWVPFSDSMLKQIKPDAKKTPILWQHGMADTIVLFEAGQEGPPVVAEVGMSCEFKAYPHLPHSVSNEELKMLQSWILNRLHTTST